MQSVADAIFLTVIVAFFGVTAWLVHFCSQLMRHNGKRP